MDLINHYTCTCADGYTGVHCESGEWLLVSERIIHCRHVMDLQVHRKKVELLL